MRLKRAHTEQPEINMTPVIDCVFQLMIFFLVATSVKKNEVAVLELPVSRRAVEVKAEQNPPIIVNILKPGFARGKPYIVFGDPYDLAGFKQFMRGRLDFNKSIGKSVNDMPALRIRADKDAELQQIQDCLIACRDVGIFQVRLGALKRAD